METRFHVRRTAMSKSRFMSDVDTAWEAAVERCSVRGVNDERTANGFS